MTAKKNTSNRQNEDRMAKDAHAQATGTALAPQGAAPLGVFSAPPPVAGNARRLTRPPMIKAEDFPEGACIVGRFLGLIPSTAPSIKTPSVHLVLQNGMEVCLPGWAALMNSLGCSRDKSGDVDTGPAAAFVGKWLVIKKGPEKLSKTFGKRFSTFDVWVSEEEPGAKK